MTLALVPMTVTGAKQFIAEKHRHHKPPTGALWAVGLSNGSELVGVATVGRPVARMLADGFTAEVTRLATDGSPNGCSMLYGACRRAAKALGYRKLVTYILASEPGTSLKASGWTCEGSAGGGSWSREGRMRSDPNPTCLKSRWSVAL